jgi:hypothetical protein
MLFKNSVRTSKRTPHFTITKIKWLMLFKEIIAVYSENLAKPINTKCSVTEWQRVNKLQTTCEVIRHGFYPGKFSIKIDIEERIPLC